jgi:hypothetical protein
MSKQPILGSAALHLPVPTSQKVQVTPSTCLNLSLFKGPVRTTISCLSSHLWSYVDLMKEYRKLDDSITMRLNRNTAAFRDRDRVGGVKPNTQEEACAYFWKDLVGTSIQLS